jgi:hypothetical protein
MSAVAEVRIRVEGKEVHVTSPYNVSFINQARSLNGKWDRDQGEWVFDARDEGRVRKLCLWYYGTDGDTAGPLTTLHVSLDGCGYETDLELGGRVLARRPGRDYRVQLGEGVVLIAGGFPARGGSAKNPCVDPRPGTVLEVRDFPLALARKLAAARGKPAVKIVTPVDPKAEALAKIRALMRTHGITAEELKD